MRGGGTGRRHRDGFVREVLGHVHGHRGDTPPYRQGHTPDTTNCLDDPLKVLVSFCPFAASLSANSFSANIQIGWWPDSKDYSLSRLLTLRIKMAASWATTAYQCCCPK